MYTNFFSLSEQPFSIAPNPKYLFMSDRHREALTHLTSGLGGSGSGGFVLLTGEVGTGKTTVSRCLMADLPEDTQLAFILNPTLSSQELLATICDQLKIRYRKTGATLKTLTDKIAEKLLKNHTNNINTLLIIDEAQHLEPEVLEQLRLLTNLETNTKKLLQVILIGQPELQQLLKRRDLRQLAQRITARYHLLPLNKQELAAYIKHRLSVADCHRALFNDGALTAIHQISQGIPRLINLICHSALMEAYNSNNAVVNKKIVYKAASQALGDDFEPTLWWQHKNIKWTAAASVVFLVLASGFWLGQNKGIHQQETLQASINSEQASLAQTEANLKQANRAEHIAEKQAQETVQQGELGQRKEEQNEVLAEPTVVEVSKLEAVEPQREIAQTQVSRSESEKAVQRTEQVKQEAKVGQNEYQVEAVDGVSDDLLARFQAAIDETKDSPIDEDKLSTQQQAQNEIKPLTQMPAWVQRGIPALIFEQHIYASDGEGWVNVNGRDRYEGDIVADGLTIEKILPQQVILTYRGETFSLPALTNW